MQSPNSGFVGVKLHVEGIAFNFIYTFEMLAFPHSETRRSVYGNYLKLAAPDVPKTMWSRAIEVVGIAGFESINF